MVVASETTQGFGARSVLDNPRRTAFEYGGGPAAVSSELNQRRDEGRKQRPSLPSMTDVSSELALSAANRLAYAALPVRRRAGFFLAGRTARSSPSARITPSMVENSGLPASPSAL